VPCAYTSSKLEFPGTSAPRRPRSTGYQFRRHQQKGNMQMMKEEINQGSKNVAVQHSSSELENIQTAAQLDAAFENKFLKFKKGTYFIGEEEVALGTEFLAHTTAWTKSWIKFADGKLAELKMYLVARGEKPPEREELDDRDGAIGRRGWTADRSIRGCTNTCCHWRICRTVMW
jgi:hypothetical protein